MPRKIKTEPKELNKPERKPLLWLSGEVKTQPFTAEGRMEAGELLRAFKKGMPFACLMRSRFQRSVRGAVHCAFEMLVKTGESCIGSTKMLS